MNLGEDNLRNQNVTTNRGAHKVMDAALCAAQEWDGHDELVGYDWRSVNTLKLVGDSLEMDLRRLNGKTN